MTGVFPVVKGVKLRATKINRCGLPIPGPRNRIVTDGFISVNVNPVMKDREELESSNAEGKVVVSDTTPATRKHHSVELMLCNVNVGLITMLNGWSSVLDYNDDPIGFQDKAEVEGDYGAALEIWTGGRSEDDCPVPSLDSVFSAPTSGKSYGYLLLGATEFVLGNIQINAGIADFTMTGITVAIPQWGRGPYNVAATDASGTAGRLLVPVGGDAHITLFRTPVEPPEATTGGEPQVLDIVNKFVDPDFYFGGPGNAPAADVAPEQDDVQSYTVTITGTPTGGDFTLTHNGNETAAIAYNAAASAVKSALVALDDGYTADDWTVTGGALPGTAVVITGPFGTLVADDSGLTGGTSPAVTIS